MADKKLSEFQSLTTLSNEDLVIVVKKLSENYANGKMTFANFLAFLQSTTGKLMTTNLSNGVKTTQALVDTLMPNNMDYVVSKSNVSVIVGTMSIRQAYFQFKSGYKINTIIGHAASVTYETINYLTPFTERVLALVGSASNSNGVPSSMFLSFSDQSTLTSAKFGIFDSDGIARHLLYSVIAIGY